VDRITFLLILAFSVIVAPTYVTARIVGVMPWRRPWKLLGWFAIEMSVFSTAIMMNIRHLYTGEEADIALRFSYLGLGFFSLLFSWTLARDLAWIPLRFTLLKDPGQRTSWLRRTSLLVVGVTLLTLAIGVWQALKTPAVNEVSIAVEDLHPDLDGYRIAHLSDIHVSDWKDSDDVWRIVERTNQQHPNLVVITGDLVDGSVTQRGADVIALEELTAPAFFVTGNHEYYSGAGPWLEFLRDLGIEILDGERRTIIHGEASLLLAGLPDPSGGHAMRTPPPTGSAADFHIMLAHRPGDAYAVSKAGYDLQLSGHTHGGQFFPFTLLIHSLQPFATGLYQQNGMQIFTSQGIGFWGPPVRLFNPTEIVLLTLRGAE
jgi:uncharacterized protein